MSQGALALLLTFAVFMVLGLIAGTLWMSGVQMLFYFGIAAAFAGVATLAYLVRPH